MSMRLLSLLFTLAAGSLGLYFAADKYPDLFKKAEEIIDFRTTTALETRFAIDQILEMHQRTLLREKGSRYLNPELKFYPYLLLEVKYSEKNKTKEGLILWDLTDGEMILDTKNWEKTHGFADCILGSTQPSEFKTIALLADKGGTADETHLLNKLNVEATVLEATLRNCVKKNLLVSLGNNKYRIHLENPKFTTTPETKIVGQLTTKTHKHAQKVNKHFSTAQVRRLSRIAFGDSFTIRKTTEIYLPVHCIVIQGGNGSIRTAHFNALTGKELPSTHFFE